MRESDRPDVRALLEEMVRRGASDLHLTAGEKPRFRVDGQLIEASDAPALGPEDTRRMAYELLTGEQRAAFEEDGEIDFSFGVEGLSRFRGNVFLQRGSVAAALRAVPFEIHGFEELGLPPVVARLAEEPRGLVLVTGPTGSGKSTTLAAMVDRVNRTRRGHVVTIEDPVEYVHAHRGCLVNQREVGTDTPSFAAALRHVLRQDPDVILIGEMRDLETVEAALTVAETGHLTLATLHTNSAAEAVSRVIDVFPAHQQSQARSQLASVLQGVVTQVLLPRAGAPGRVVACEVLVATPAIRNLVREDKTHQIYSLMQTGRQHGMQTLNDALRELWAAREVDLEDAMRVSHDPEELRGMVSRSAP